MITEARRRGQGSGFNVKYLVGVMYGGTHTLRRHAGQPTDLRQASCGGDQGRPQLEEELRGQAGQSTKDCFHSQKSSNPH